MCIRSKAYSALETSGEPNGDAAHLSVRAGVDAAIDDSAASVEGEVGGARAKLDVDVFFHGVWIPHRTRGTARCQ